MPWSVLLTPGPVLALGEAGALRVAAMASAESSGMESRAAAVPEAMA